MQLLDATLLETQDPELAAAIRFEEERQRENLELIASENYASAAVREAMASRADQQVRRRLSRAGATTAAASSSTSPSRWRSTRVKQLFGAEHANVQPHAGAQANMAVFMAVLRAGRHGARDVARARRPPHARHEGQLQREALQRGRVRRAARHRADRLRRSARAGARAQAEADRRRRERLPAHDGLRAVPRDRRRSRRASAWSTWRTSRGWSRSACILRRCRSPSSSRRRRTRRCAVRAAASSSPTKRTRAALDKSVFPGHPRRPVDARDRRQSRRVRRGAAARVSQPTSSRCVVNAQAMGEELQRGRRAARRGRHRHASAARRPEPEEPHRQSGRSVSRRDRASP